MPSKITKVILALALGFCCGVVIFLSISSSNLTVSPEFSAFVQLNNKAYFNQDEFNFRATIFERNTAKINEMNKISELQDESPDRAVFRMNRFGDITDEEFKRYYLSAVVPEGRTLPDFSQAPPENLEDGEDYENLPNYVNWRK